MRLRIGRLLLIVFFVLPMQGNSQNIARNNSIETSLIYGWNSTIIKRISKQTDHMTKISTLQGTMSQEFGEMKTWQHKYNSYLKEARGYAEALKAGTTLFSNGIMTFIRLANLEKAVSVNPQGIAATFAMNDMYIETAIEMIKTYRLIKSSVTKGGALNMLNGAERTELLWIIDEQLEKMNQKFHQLAISIAFYNIKDVWLQSTAGMIERDHAEIAKQAMDRWKRAQKVSSLF